jgi:hypothetical protein
MRRIFLIACGKRKRDSRTKARDLYQGELFRKSMAYAQSLKHDAIYILSAKHGLLELDTEIDPYDQTLNKMKIMDVKAWALRVLEQLQRVADVRNDQFIFLAAVRYRRYLLPYLVHYDVPMKGLGIGRQLQFLTRGIV